MKKTICLVLSFMLCISFLAGCGSSPSGAPVPSAEPASSPSATATPEATPATDKKQDILLWLPPFGTADSLDMEFWTNNLAPWAEENNVNLSIEITPWGNYEEKYLTAFASGTGPDVGYMYLEMFNDFIEMGSLEPLDGSFTQEEKDNYLYFDKGFIKGHQYTVPFIVGNARILYFNMDILAQAGVTELPVTWEDLTTVTLKVKEANLDGVIPFAQEWADPAIGALNNIFYPYLWQAGGDIYNEDGIQVALMDNDAAVRAARFLHDLRFKHQVIPEESMSLSGNEIRTLFQEGRVAVSAMAAASASILDEAGINWDFVPSLKDQTTATWVAADALIVNSSSQNKDLAVSLIKYITSAEIMAGFHKEISSFPPLTKDEPYGDNPRFKDMYADSQSLRTLPVATNAFKVMDTLYKHLQLMMLGDLTPEQAIEQTVTYSQSLN